MTEVIADRYLLVRLLGRGGMSDVYDAVDQQENIHVALKMVRSADPELARRLAQEAQALEGFTHPGLVRLLDSGVSGDQAYLVMDLVDGTTLAETIRRGPLTTAGTATLGASVADALAYVHARGVVHRDVKPANILLTADGKARLGDFGIARLLDASTLTLTGTTLGTTGYMAPEQLEDHQVGASADIWSLGIVLVECLTGRRVYDGTPNEVIARRLAGPVPVPDDLPVPWKLMLTGMLDNRPDHRLDAAQVADLLGTAAFRAAWQPAPTERAVPPPVSAPDDLTALSPLTPEPTVSRAAPDTRVTPTPPPPGLRSPDRRRWLGALGVLVALCAAGLVWLGTRPGSHPHATAANRSDSTTQAPVTSIATTTTTIPNGPTALAALVRDAASGVTAGSVDAGSGQAISNQAEQAVADEAAGKPNQAANDLQQVAMTIANGVQRGSIQQGEGAVLQADLSALATALGLSAASTPPTAPPGPGPGPGPGHAHGPGGGKGG